MAYYLVQATHTPEVWATLVKNPQNRMEVVRSLAEQLGGKVEGAWLAFGEYDIIAILEMPDNVSAAAFSMVGTAGGGLKAIKTTPLMTVEEGVSAMKKAGTGVAAY